MDAGPMDISIKDFPEECPDKEVSPAIGNIFFNLLIKWRRDIEKDSVQRCYHGRNQ